MSKSFAVRLELPWEDPIGLAEPTNAQWNEGIVVRMLTTMCGNAHHKKGELYLMDVPQAERLIEATYARRETEREMDMAKAAGHKRGPTLTGHPAVDGEADGQGQGQGQIQVQGKGQSRGELT